MIRWKTVLGHIPGFNWISFIRSNARAQWFDWRHRVKTRGDEDPRSLTVVGGNVAHALPYIPTTARFGRHLLRDLPIKDVSSYTFIDMGSGKGRMLLLAAELPFRRIIGVEFSRDLQILAQNNVKTYRNRKQVCFQIETVNQDATEYKFPPDPLLVYFFFPFDRPVMEPVIQNLNRSLVEHPRDVIVVYHNPILSDLVEAASHLRIYARGSHLKSSYTVFRSSFRSTGE
jgi:SAM-dependent methyltransferase